MCVHLRVCVDVCECTCIQVPVCKRASMCVRTLILKAKGTTSLRVSGGSSTKGSPLLGVWALVPSQGLRESESPWDGRVLA